MKFEIFLNEKGLNQNDLAEKSAEQLAALYNEFNAKKTNELETAIEAKATKEDINSLKEEIQKGQLEQMKALNDSLRERDLILKKLSDNEKEDLAQSVDSIKKALVDGIDKLKSIKDGENGKLSFKAPADMLLSTNVSGGNVPVEQRLSGMDAIKTRTVRMLDVVNRGTAESNIITWVSQANKDGAAGGTTEGAVKNQIDFDLVVNSETVKKRTAFIKVSTEMIDDVSYIRSEIENELMRELLLDVESQVDSGDGTGNNLNGIRTQATAWAAGTRVGTVDNANEADVLVRGVEQIELSEQDSPNYIFANPFDINTLKFIKTSTTDRRYIDRLQLIGGDLTLDGIPIIKTTLIPQGEFLIGAFNLATLYDKGAISMEIGRDSDDFTKNLVTILAEWRGLLLIKTNDVGAFITGNFGTSKTALNV